MKIYLDVCCLNRPFDDQTQLRVRLETEAILSIMEQADLLGWIILGSDVIDYEIAQIPDPDRRTKVFHFAAVAGGHIGMDAAIIKRAEMLAQQHGFKTMDALHLSCAEHKKADIPLTTDDDFIQKAGKCGRILQTKSANPMRWLAEIGKI